ncbi:crinkler (CRN) family protein, partial [Phytophthora infestans T30-4]
GWLVGEDVKFVPTLEDVESMNTPVHVLVVAPGIITTVEVRERKDEMLMAELAYYQRLGQEIQIKCHSCCGAILDKIDTIYEEGSHPKPFICVEGSSGMGKSQLAFSLGGEGRKYPRPWFYWPLLSAGEEMQRVYWNFSSIATAFESVVKKDELEKLPKAEILNSASSFYTTQKLWTYGFIIELLRYDSRADVGAQMIRVENETFEVAKCGLKDVIDARTKINNRKVLPFFILDEMTPSGEIPNMMKLAAFQRNVFRACGLVVIVMGTDAKISNLVSQSQHSRTGSHWWMTVVSSFPTYQSISSPRSCEGRIVAEGDKVASRREGHC